MDKRGDAPFGPQKSCSGVTKSTSDEDVNIENGTKGDLNNSSPTHGATANAVRGILNPAIYSLVGHPMTSSSPSLVNESKEGDDRSLHDAGASATIKGSYALCDPLTRMMLNTMDEPPSREVDAVLTDLLLCSPQQPLPLAEEVLQRDSSAADRKETYVIRDEDVEDHRRSMIHSHHPLQSAARRHRKHRAKDFSVAIDSRRKDKGRRKTEPGASTDDTDASLDNGLDSVFSPINGTPSTGFDFNRSMSEPLEFSSPKQQTLNDSKPVEKLLPISEEHVKFDLGQEVDEKGYEGITEETTETPTHKNRRRSRHHKLSLQLGLPDRPSSDNLAKRWVSGDKVHDPGASLHHEMKLDDHDRMLKKVDIDHVASHRFDYHRPAHKMKRQSSAQVPSVVFGDVAVSDGTYRTPLRQPIDHTAHDVFVELDELEVNDDGQMQWKERARWIKYEEDVELGGEWGKPHVSTLSFHSLHELRKLLEHGLPLFDIPETTVPGIVHRICSALRERGALDDQQAQLMENALLLTHSSQQSVSDIQRKLRKISLELKNGHKGDMRSRRRGISASSFPSSHSFTASFKKSPMTNGNNYHELSHDITGDTVTMALADNEPRLTSQQSRSDGFEQSTGTPINEKLKRTPPRLPNDSSKASLSRDRVEYSAINTLADSDCCPLEDYSANTVLSPPSPSSFSYNPIVKHTPTSTATTIPPSGYHDSVPVPPDSPAQANVEVPRVKSALVTPTHGTPAPKNSVRVSEHKYLSANAYSGSHQDAKVNIGFEGDQHAGTPTAVRKSSMFSNLIGGNSSSNQMTDIEKRLPEGAEVANVWVGSVQFLNAPIMVFVRLAQGMVLNTVSEVRMPVRFIFVLMGPVTLNMFSEDYHEIGRAMSTLMSYKDFRNACYIANDPKDLIMPMNAFLDGSVVVPAHGWNKGNVVQMLEDIRLKMIEIDKQRRRKKQRGERRDSRRKSETEDADDGELRRTGSCGGGLIKDIKRRYPLYLSDIKDAINFQCLSVIIFIFFAVLTPSITFGADVELVRVNSWMGVTETIIGSAFMGALFGLLCGQPLLIIGCTGPLAVFEGSLYDVAKRISEENYMAFRCWVGIWLFVICVLTALLELSFVLKYFTRFTEEIFAMLVSLIFCVSVVESLFKIFDEHPLLLPGECDVNLPWNDTISSTCLEGANSGDTLCASLSSLESDVNYCCELPHHQTSTPNTALLSLILTVGCFIIAYFLKQFRSSPFLSKNVRKALGDFGVPIAILIMTVIDMMLDDRTKTKKLNFPDKFQPTKNNQLGSTMTRDWLISPFALEAKYWWLALVAVMPAILVFFLIFIEIQITARILNKKEHRLQKGTGYHLNIFVIGLSGIICGVFGCPWVTGATVRSVSHTSACTVTDSHHAPGEKPKMSVREQRVTSIMVNVLLGLSVLLKSVLKHVPYAVLYGVFFYMGIACLGSLQFYDRIKLMFMQRKNYPSAAYVHNVSGVKTHVFTIIQIMVVAVLWVVKESPASIAFPFFLILLVPLRLKVLPLFYTEVELKALDSEEVDAAVDDDDTDYNLTAHMPY